MAGATLLVNGVLFGILRIIRLDVFVRNADLRCNRISARHNIFRCYLLRNCKFTGALVVIRLKHVVRDFYLRHEISRLEQ